MAKKKPPGREPVQSGRKKYKYVGLPIELYDELEDAADEEERSIQWMAKRAVREYLDRRNAAKNAGL